jgi:hypothetical protein
MLPEEELADIAPQRTRNKQALNDTGTCNCNVHNNEVVLRLGAANVKKACPPKPPRSRAPGPPLTKPPRPS